MSPRDEDFISKSVSHEFLCHCRWILIREPEIEFHFEGFGKRLDGESGSVALFAVGGSEDVIEMERLPINFVLLEVVDVGIGPLFARFRESIADLRLFCVPDDQDDLIRERAILTRLVEQKGSEEQTRIHTDIVAQQKPS